MSLALIYIAAPLAVFLLLAVLPRGRTAAAGLGLAALLLALGWATRALGLPPFASASAHDDGYLALILAVLTGAGLAAALAQGLRAAWGPGRPGWLYPLVATFILVAAAVPALTLLGL